MTDSLLIERKPGYIVLTINRPDRRNALDETVTKALTDALQDIAQDPAIRAVVITGAGSAFMAGGDISMFDTLLSREGDKRTDQARRLIDKASNAIRALHALPQPVIAAVEGPCVGYGLSLMMACDLAVAANDASFMLAHLGIGASPDGGATWMLTRLLGSKRAFGIALLQDRFDAQTALDWGLLNKMCPKGEALAEAEALAARLAAGPRSAQHRTKKLLRAAWNTPLDPHLDAEAACFADVSRSADFEEGVAAFRERRKPKFGH
ncbi:enoyl-CoA hydratase-related protein [uncultured Roseibium sp.]|uniref:enoyl-CoA hydratase/isomerase family protein n=1 Tax=uncultured Roseibium sp. TaxID=1936171 RepID=UPI00321663E1